MAKFKTSFISILVVMAMVLSFVPAVEVSAETIDGEAPQNLMVPPAAYDDSEIILIWDKPSDYETKSISDYEVWCSENGGEYKKLGTARTNFAENYVYINTFIESFYANSSSEHYQIDIHSYTAKNLQEDTSYSFKVRAIYSDSTYSNYSSELTQQTSAKAQLVDVIDYGAEYITDKSGNYSKKNAGGDADTIADIEANTKAIQAAIDACPEGGKVVLSGSGDNANPYYYVSGSLFLHSNMTFMIEEGAVLLGSPVSDHYPRSLLVYEYSQDIRSYGLINAVTWDYGTLENIRIVGEGAVDGNGWNYASSSTQTQTALDPIQGIKSPVDPTGNNWNLPNYYAGSRNNVSTNGILAGDAMDKANSDEISNYNGTNSTKNYNTRPNLVVARGVSGLYYGGLTFYNPAFHGIVNYQSESITCNGAVGLTYNANNGDGIEFGDCYNMYVFNSFWDTGDDAINFAAGQGATERNTSDRVACGEGKVFNNFVRNGHGGLLALGSHLGGWIGDLVAEDNVYNSCESGNVGVIRLKGGATTGGGIRNIVFRDSAANFTVAGGAFINIDTSYTDSNASTAFSPESDYALTYENINAKNLTITGLTKAIMTVASPGTSSIAVTPVITNFSLENITDISGTSAGISLNSLTDSSFKNINANITVTDCKNITIEDCGTDGTQDSNPTDLLWGSSDELVTTVIENKINVSWQAVTGAESYKVLVNDGYKTMEYTTVTDTNAELTLAPNTTYTISVQPENSDSYGAALENTVTTATTATAISAPGMPTDTTVTLYGESGISWQALTWNKAEDSDFGVHYYKIVAEPSNGGETKTYRAYFDREDRAGYALWELEDGVTYTATVYAVNWAGDVTEAYSAVSFTTVPSTLTEIPSWTENSELTVTGNGITDDMVISWDVSDVTDHANGNSAEFAGYRVMINGVPRTANGGADQVNATATTTDSTYIIPAGTLEYNTEYTISVEAGDNILKIASGSGGLDGSTGFIGTANTVLARNQITFGKWTGHGPSVTIYSSDTITISFNTLGGSTVDEISGVIGELITAPDEPRLEGYTFTGWYKEAECENLWDFDTDTVAADTILYAGWKAITCTITYDGNGGEGTDADGNTYTTFEDFADYDDDYKIFTNEDTGFTRDGYDFIGWSIDENSEVADEDYAPGSEITITSDMTLYAVWSKLVEYGPTVTYYANYEGNNNSNAEEIGRGSTYIIRDYNGLGLDIQESCYFVGWNTQSDGSGDSYEFGSEIIVEASIVLYAQWNKIIDFKTDHVAYIVGYSDGTIRPEADITRAETVTIFFRVLTDDSRSYNWSKENDYYDVESSEWYNNAISTMTKAGAIEGYDTGDFKPENSITRAEFVQIVVNLYGLDSDTNASKFTDISGYWAEDAINIAYENGLVVGDTGSTLFRPSDMISRAEAMTIVNRLLGRDTEIGGYHADMITWTDNADTREWYYEAVQKATNSHEFEIGADGKEYWTAIFEAPDWEALENEWATVE